jgi:hypothetical protein
MTKDKLDIWIEHLESGRYSRGINYLYNPTSDKYCCLGVLALIDGCLVFNGGAFGSALWGNTCHYDGQSKLGSDLDPDPVQDLMQVNDSGSPPGSQFETVVAFLREHFAYYEKQTELL